MLWKKEKGLVFEGTDTTVVRARLARKGANIHLHCRQFIENYSHLLTPVAQEVKEEVSDEV